MVAAYIKEKTKKEKTRRVKPIHPLSYCFGAIKQDGVWSALVKLPGVTKTSSHIVYDF